MSVNLRDEGEESPRHRKHAKKRHVRSNHRHDYECVCIDSHSFVNHGGVRTPYYHVGERCRECGRMRNVWARRDLHEPPEGMRLFDTGDYLCFAFARKLPESMEVDA